MNKVIEVKNLVKEYKGKRAVDDLSFDVYEGEQIEKGYKSIAIKFKIVSYDKTLVDSEIEG